MMFINYHDAEPIIEEYPPETAVKILLRQHQEFDDFMIDDSTKSAVECFPTVTSVEVTYAMYTIAVAAMRTFYKELSIK